MSRLDIVWTKAFVVWLYRYIVISLKTRQAIKFEGLEYGQIVDLNDAMVALVAPLGGVGQDTQVAFQLFPNITASHQGLPNERLPWTWLLQVALGTLNGCWKVDL